MNRILVTGYRSFELGIFQDKDEKIGIIRKAIERELVSYFEEGAEWLIFMGNLGFEYWVLEVANKLKKDYEFQTATIFPFANHGQNWNEANQRKLELFKQADVVQSAYQHYENATQFAHYHQFLLEHSDQAYVFYDSENETKLKYLLQKMKENPSYFLNFLTFDRLNEIAQEE